VKSFAVCHTLYADASMVVVLLVCSTVPAAHCVAHAQRKSQKECMLIFMMLIILLKKVAPPASFTIHEFTSTQKYEARAGYFLTRIIKHH